MPDTVWLCIKPVTITSAGPAKCMAAGDTLRLMGDLIPETETEIAAAIQLGQLLEFASLEAYEAYITTPESPPHEIDVEYAPICSVCGDSVYLDDDDQWVHSDD